MKRYEEIDILKGVAVICMITFHIFYFPNMYGFKEFKYDTMVLKIIAKVAQIIFITCVGINLVFAKKKTNDASYHLKRIGKIAFYAVLMSLFTYHVFQERYVKFGILHFIAFSSLLLFTFVDNVETMKVMIALFGSLFILNKLHPKLFSRLPPPLAFIGGFYNDRYSSIDHFPILPWILLICIGSLIGHHLINNEINTPGYLIDNPLSDVLKNIGKRSLEIYAVHWVILYLVYCIIYSKFIRK